MKLSVVVLLSLLLSACNGVDVANVPANVMSDAAVAPSGSASMLQNPDSGLTKLNATVAGNNVLVTRSNIIIVGDQDKQGAVDFIKNMVMRGRSPQDDDALTTQIIALLGPGNNTAPSSDFPGQMLPMIKNALRSRGKPAQLRQIIVKLTEMSPTFGVSDENNNDAK